MGEHVRPTENLLLSGLPGDAYRRVEADLSPVEFTAGGKLAHAIGDIERFYFIVSGLVSIIHTSADDHTTEIAVVGAEGGVGVTLVLARHQLPVEAVIQVPGTRPGACLHIACARSSHAEARSSATSWPTSRR